VRLATFVDMLGVAIQCEAGEVLMQNCLLDPAAGLRRLLHQKQYMRAEDRSYPAVCHPILQVDTESCSTQPTPHLAVHACTPQLRVPYRR
jgi:hypothetical protein